MTVWGDPAAVHALGWTLLHFVWQGAAVGLGAWLLLLGLRRAPAAVRYVAACGALVAAMATFGATLAWQVDRIAGEADTRRAALAALRTRDGVPVGVPSPAAGQDDIATSGAVAREPLLPAARLLPLEPDPLLRAATAGPAAPAWTARVDRWLPHVVAAWGAGVVLLLLRLFGGWVRAERLRYRLVRPVEERVRRQLEEIAQRLRVWKPVWVLESGAVEVPTLIGWLRPLILLPATTVERLGSSQLAAILAHELAHVRRHDYLINLVQSVMETILFYHPAIWWVSRRIREERELCCDDIALGVAEPADYSRALLVMEELRPRFAAGWHAAASPAMAATGGDLLARITRLMLPEPAKVPRPALSTMALVVAFFVWGGAPSLDAGRVALADLPPAPTPEPLPADAEFFRQANQPITLHLERVTTAEAAREIERLTGLTLHLPPGVEGDPVTLRFDRTEADVVYQCLFNLKNMDWREDAATRSVTATFWEGSGPTPHRHRILSVATFHATQHLRRQLRHAAPWVQVAGRPLREVLDDVHVVTGLEFRAPDALLDRPVTLTSENASVRGLLLELGRQVGFALDYAEDASAVELIPLAPISP